MASNDLIFEQSPLLGVPDLVFGASDTAVIPDVSLTAAGVISGLRGHVRLLAAPSLSAVGVISGLRGHVRLTLGAVLSSVSPLSGLRGALTIAYDNRLTRYLQGAATAPHNAATMPRPSQATGWGISRSQRGGQPHPWQRAQRHGRALDVPASPASTRRAAQSAAWQLAAYRRALAAFAYQRSARQRAAVNAYHQLATALGYVAASGQQAGSNRRYRATVSWQLGVHLGPDRAAVAGASLYRIGRQAEVAPWQHGQIPHTGREVIVVVLPPNTSCYTPSGDLLFSFPWEGSANIVFSCGNYVTPSVPTTLYILPARFYMTAHTIFAQRVPDNQDVPIFDATVAADSGSYCWSLTASGPASLFELLAPTGGLPAQLRVTLDGLPFLFAVDSMARTHQFGQTGVRIQGRSVTSLVAAPYLRATVRNNASGAMLAQQLAAAALDGTGIALDWGVGSGALANAGLTDWLVPAGAWSHSGTPLDAVQAIAQAAGGYLQSARNAATLLTRHPYGQRTGDNPGAPWGWMTGAADVELAPDALITEGVTRKDGPDLNAVYVSGTTQGVLALVKRSGSAGDKLGAMATDPLITHVDAARQRGLGILGAAGSKYDVAIELPVLTGLGQPGILDVGQLVQINAAQPWRGRVRAVSVAAKAPSLRQTVTLERHLEIA